MTEMLFRGSSFYSSSFALFLASKVLEPLNANDRQVPATAEKKSLVEGLPHLGLYR
jgi:hypothetical protein